MELILVRHGLPEHVVRDDGTPADPPLSETGVAQAHAVAEWLDYEHIDAICSSPMRRALQTAEPTSLRRSLEIRVEPEIAEYDAHASEYVPLEKLKAEDPERWRAMVQGGYSEDAERFREFASGVVDTLERVIADHRGKRVAVFCHGGVINVWACHVLGLEPTLFSDVRYTSVNRFMAASSGERSLISLNEAAHLRDLAH